MIISSAMRLIKNEWRFKGFNVFQRMPETAPPSALHCKKNRKYLKILINCCFLEKLLFAIHARRCFAGRRAQIDPPNRTMSFSVEYQT